MKNILLFVFIGLFSLLLFISCPQVTKNLTKDKDTADDYAPTYVPKVYISHYDLTSNDLKLTTNESGSWVSSVIDMDILDGTELDEYTSMAMDNYGKLHISYYYHSAVLVKYSLKYATNKTGTWVTEEVDSNNTGVGQFSSLAVDSYGYVHISYYDATNQYLKYATNKSGVWVAETLDDGNGGVNNVGQYSSIALDSNNNVHISYYDSTNLVLKYATNKSGVWVAETLDDGNGGVNNVGQYSSIAIDSNNNVHISYYDVTNTNLMYVTNSSGSWPATPATIESTDNVGQYSSIAIDQNNNVHISYQNTTFIYLHYATNSSGSWVKKIADDGNGGTKRVGNYTSIVVK